MSHPRSRIVFRLYPHNRLTLPLLLHVWERDHLDEPFEIILSAQPPPETLRLGRADAIIYSFMTPHLPEVAAEISAIRSTHPLSARPLLVAGGPQACGNAEMTLAAGFDWVLSGAGEELMPVLAAMLLSASDREPRIIRSQETIDWRDFLPVSRRFRTLPPLEITRGCHWRCAYCQTGSRGPEFRSLDSIREYLAVNRERGFQRVGLISPSALEYGSAAPGKADLDRLEEMLVLCRAGGGRFFDYGIFPSEIRPDTATIDALRLLKKYVSNRSVTIGAQSGCDRRLRQLDRGHGLQAVEEALAAADEAGFWANLDFILALPDETPAERQETFSFIRRLAKGRRLKAHIHHFFPLAGSRLEWRLPSFLEANEREELLQMRRDGIVTDWWVEGERRARAYFAWIELTLPHFQQRYH